MSYKVIDNFLEEGDFKTLQSLILGSRDNANFNWNIITDVAHHANANGFNEQKEEQLWNWYGIHPVYVNEIPLSPHYNYITQLFCNKLEVKSLLRIKINFYPHTAEVKEHDPHQDYTNPHFGALFSLNTCNGYTKLSNGDKINSVANRVLLFDPSEYHNSTTTSDQKGSYNINFNWF